MSRVLSRVGVSYQIGLVGLIDVIGLIVVALVYCFGSVQLDAANQALAHSNSGLAKLAEIKLDLLESRRAEKDFLLRRKEDYAKKHEAAFAEFTRDASELRAMVGEERRAQLDKVSAAIAQYQRQFNLVLDEARKVGLDENSGLQGKLRGSVHDIEALVAGDKNDGLDAAMLAMRRDEKDFFARLDRKYIGTMKEAAARFEAKVASAEIPAEQKPVLKAKLAAYQSDFLAAAETSLQQVEAVAMLSKSYSDAEPLIADLDRLAQEKAGEERAAAEATSARTTRTIGWVLVAMIGVVGMLAWLIGRSVARPLTGMAVLMERLAKGDLDITVTATDRKDEVGTLARSLDVFKQNALDGQRLRGEQEEMKRQAEIDKKIMLNKLADDFETGVRASLDTLASAATEMRATSQSMSATAEETSAQATTVAAAAEQASANVQTVATATEELSSSVAEIGRQVTQSTKIAGQAVDEAGRTNVTVQGLSSAAQKIGDVVKLISDIASQTNLLALNATIEAARAGDAGKGFAVVASEVKSLANQTAKATDEISAQVAAMQGATSEAVEAIKSIGGTIGSINEIATTIASAVEEQSAATQEIARNVQEAAQGTGQVSSNIVGVNQAAGETGAAASQVLVAAEELGKQTETLRADVGAFVAKIRAS